MSNPADLIDKNILRAWQMSQERTQQAPAHAQDTPDHIVMREDYEFERVIWNTLAHNSETSASDIIIESQHSMINARLYKPSGEYSTKNLIIFIHGGGFVLGSNDTHDGIQRLHAEKFAMPVLGLNYSLSPEYQYPIAEEQITNTIDFIAHHMPDFGLDSNATITLAGDSAGAYLALDAAIRLHGRAPLHALLLYYGAFGLNDGPSKRRFGNDDFGLSHADMRYYYRAHFGDVAHNYDSDLLAQDLSNVPPCYIMAAACDPVLDDSIALAQAVSAHDIPHWLDIVAGMTHGFMHYSAIVDQVWQVIQNAREFHQAPARHQDFLFQQLLDQTLTSQGPKKHSVMLSKHKTSYSIEPILMEELQGFADELGMSISSIINAIDQRCSENLSCTIRLFLAHCRAARTKGWF